MDLVKEMVSFLGRAKLGTIADTGTIVGILTEPGREMFYKRSIVLKGE